MVSRTDAHESKEGWLGEEYSEQKPELGVRVGDVEELNQENNIDSYSIVDFRLKINLTW